jgi:hypothetical protein
MENQTNTELGIPITKEEVSIIKDLVSLTGGNAVLTLLILGGFFYLKYMKRDSQINTLKCDVQFVELKDKQNQMNLKLKDQQMVLNDVLDRVEELEKKD